MKAKETSHGFKNEFNPIFSKSQYYNNHKKMVKKEIFADTEMYSLNL